MTEDVQHLPLSPLEPGVHQIDTELYHSDVCPEPSLSASGIGTLLDLTPAHFAARHPRLTKFPQRDEPSEEMELGTIIHSMVLGAGQAFKVLEFKNYYTNAAKEARANARAAGQVPILTTKYYEAMAVAAQLDAQLQALFGKWPIGDSERTIIWQRDTPYGRIWCRALADHLFIDDTGAIIIDLKTTALPLSDLSKKIAADNDDIQAAWYIEGVETLFPNLAGKVSFIDVFAETKPPYLTRPVPIPEGWLTMARRQCDRAAAIFAECLQAGQWPGWTRPAEVHCPTWREQRWMDAELAEGTAFE